MDNARLLLGLLLPWALGIAALLAWRDPRRPLRAPGELAWCIGAGYLLGVLLLTGWMRALSLAGIAFGVSAIALPLALAVIALGALTRRRAAQDLGAGIRAAWHELIAPSGTTVTRCLWWGLLAWLALRFALLGYEVSAQPLYPWEAWIEWATKARVYFEARRIVPFVSVDQWLTASGGVWFDASPQNPITLPLLQTWACIALGQWNDVLMNWPWWQFAVALALVVYGGLARLGIGPKSALLGAYFAASLPLVDVHVALAGYADLPLACFVVAAALAFMHWRGTRRQRDAVLALLLVAACPLIKATGAIYVFAAIPGLVMAWWPRRAPKLVLGAFGLALFAAAVLAQTFPVVAGRSLHLAFAPAWPALGEDYFLFANWHLLWYGLIAVAALAWRQMLEPPLSALTAVVVTGGFLVLLLFCFPTLHLWLVDPPTVERATLHWAPLLVVYLVLAFCAYAAAWSARHSQPAPEPESGPAADAPTTDAAAGASPAMDAF